MDALPVKTAMGLPSSFLF